MTGPARTDALRRFGADLHVHTVGSPCAEIEMIPPLIVERARELGLGLVAVTDHNSAQNVAAVMEAAEGSGVHVLPGMEVQTREEVHVVCLFDRVEQAWAWQERVYAALPPLANDPRAFGVQLVVDCEGNVRGTNERLLLVSVALTIEQVVEEVRRLGGLCIAAHVDRPSFSLLANLGLVPEGLPLAALELTPRTDPREARARFPQVVGWPLIVSGDAHRLVEMGAWTTLTMAEPSVAEVALALAGTDGRSVEVAVHR